VGRAYPLFLLPRGVEHFLLTPASLLVRIAARASVSQFQLAGVVNRVVGQTLTLRRARRLVVRGRPPGRAAGRTGAIQTHAALVRSVS